LKQGVDFWPMALGHAGKVANLPLVFVGHGITNAKADYDDYANVDATDKVVVLIRGTPHPENKDLVRELTEGAPFVKKIANAEKHHAAAVLVVNDRATARTGDDLLDFNFTALDRKSSATIPAFHIHRSVLETLLKSRSEKLDDLEQTIDRGAKPQARELTG